MVLLYAQSDNSTMNIYQAPGIRFQAFHFTCVYVLDI